MLPGWTAVIVNYNGAGYLEACLAALERAQPKTHDVVVVDNASTDDSLQELHGFPRVNVLAQQRNLGFAAGANVGLAAVETELALLLNPDVEVEPDIGAALVAAFAADARLGAAGALLLYPDGKTIQHAGGVVERPLMLTRHRGYGETDLNAFGRVAEVDFVTGAALGVRLAAVNGVGGFDETFSPVYYEDVDLCYRLRDAGWGVRFVPTLRALHHEGVTLERSDAYYRHLHRNRLRFALRYLTAAEWREAFVPAEYARLRHELWTLTEGGWAERSGASAVEAVLRGNERDWEREVTPCGPAPASLEELAAEAQATWEVVGRPIPRAGWIRRRLADWLGLTTLRHDVNVALDQQRAFNAATTRALEAQDTLNREQTAALLLLGLDLIGELRREDSRRGDRSASDPAG